MKPNDILRAPDMARVRSPDRRSSQMYRAYHAFRGRGLSNQEARPRTRCTSRDDARS